MTINNKLNKGQNMKSSHTIVDRNLLKSMQNDITYATKVISELREEKEKLKSIVQLLKNEIHEKSLTINSLKLRLKSFENLNDDDEMIKELSHANLKLKAEIELSVQGNIHKSAKAASEIFSLTDSFIEKTHANLSHYSIFKTHMKSSDSFKQIVAKEKWQIALLQLLRFYEDIYADSKTNLMNTETISEESEQENYSKIIQDGKHLLTNLNYRKTKLESLNQQYSIVIKRSPTNSPVFNKDYSISNIASEKFLSPERKNQKKGESSSTNRLVNSTSNFKSIPKSK